jgi:hypothetical protein
MGQGEPVYILGIYEGGSEGLRVNTGHRASSCVQVLRVGYPWYDPEGIRGLCFFDPLVFDARM